MTTLYTGAVCPDPTYLHTPLIEIVGLDDDSEIRTAAASLQTFDYLLFTSRFAVKYWAESGGGFDVKNIVSIGATTTATLRKMEVAVTIHQPQKDDSYGVIDWFSTQERGRVLIPRSNLALPIIPDGLRALGFDVTTVTAYINRMPANPIKVDLDDIDKIIFTSPSTIDNFVKLYGGIPKGKEIAARGVVTKARLEEYLP
jgi:uroporphyrinogen-III synthase